MAGAAGYEVQFRFDGAFTDADEVIDTSGQMVYRREGLAAGTSVFLRVRSYAGAGDDRLWSGWTTALPAMTLAPRPHLEVSPCTGTVVRAEQPRWNDTPNWRSDTASVTTLMMEFTAGSEAVAFDWFGPYDGKGEGGRAGLQVVMVDWTTEGMPGGVRHAMTFAWPTGFSPDLEAGLRFRADNDACPGEPAVICTATGCELRPAGDESAGFRQHAR